MDSPGNMDFGLYPDQDGWQLEKLAEAQREEPPYEEPYTQKLLFDPDSLMFESMTDPIDWEGVKKEEEDKRISFRFDSTFPFQDTPQHDVQEDTENIGNTTEANYLPRDNTQDNMCDDKEVELFEIQELDRNASGVCTSSAGKEVVQLAHRSSSSANTFGVPFKGSIGNESSPIESSLTAFDVEREVTTSQKFPKVHLLRKIPKANTVIQGQTSMKRPPSSRVRVLPKRLAEGIDLPSSLPSHQIAWAEITNAKDRVGSSSEDSSSVPAIVKSSASGSVKRVNSLESQDGNLRRASRRGKSRATQQTIRASSARQELKGKPSFSDLVSAGYMKPGIHKFSVGHVEVSASVCEDGAIHYAGSRYRAVSKFALVVLRERNPSRQSCDGWKEVSWNGEKLDVLRSRVQQPVHQMQRVNLE